MKLKSLRHVVLSDYAPNPETVFEAHGPKLTQLELPDSTAQALGVKMFDLCPNLQAILLSVNGHPPGPRCFSSPRVVRHWNGLSWRRHISIAADNYTRTRLPDGSNSLSELNPKSSPLCAKSGSKSVYGRRTSETSRRVAGCGGLKSYTKETLTSRTSMG
ncbi:hypothetical protein DFH08DRAFT_863562 [Mycena albidolilacea]|uniref:Uncharacterized protein n=1 Tax=Mycena albidolilacea TaxID=1033008 RepID=A0AAD7A3S1_9AGAR|nr:hypothetical protein DFH08DRAFT_863562 [Mycena albidolilacea]